jgi:acyl-CoA thioester hydrolase
VDTKRFFSFSVRVPYGHTDQMGIVYYANYLLYFEMARTEMLRECNLTYKKLEERNILLPAIEAHCFYKGSAHYDDLLAITSNCSMQGIRIRIDYKIRVGRQLITTGYTVHICRNKQGKILKPPEYFKRLFSVHEK